MEIYVNKVLGDVGSWEKVSTPEPDSNTRHLRVVSDPDHLLITGAGVLPPSTSNTAQVGVLTF